MGLFLTSILQSTWEDLLAVALAGLAGYVAVLGLPLRRGDIKGKLEKAAASLAEVRRAASWLSCLLAWLGSCGAACRYAQPVPPD